jgi:hypothetical protein
MRRLSRFLPSALLGLLLLGGSSPAAAQVSADTSEYTNTLTIKSEALRTITPKKYAGKGASLSAAYEKDTESGEETWKLSVYGFADSTTAMTSAQRVRVQVNGRSLQPLQTSTRTRDLDDEEMVEIKEMTFTRSIYEDIAAADRVLVTIGPARFYIPTSARSDMRAILDRVPSGESRPTASSDEGTGGGLR